MSKQGDLSCIMGRGLVQPAFFTIMTGTTHWTVAGIASANRIEREAGRKAEKRAWENPTVLVTRKRG
jgi:hypothetical protein